MTPPHGLRFDGIVSKLIVASEAETLTSVWRIPSVFLNTALHTQGFTPGSNQPTPSVFKATRFTKDFRTFYSWPSSCSQQHQPAGWPAV